MALSTELITTFAPGRAELLGNHTDYNEGFVLAIAVEGGTTFSGRVRADRNIHLHASRLRLRQEVALDELRRDKVSAWSRYSLGVVDQFQRAGLPLGGFEAEIQGNLPIGAGLSSSASLENATGLFLARAFGAELTPLQLAKLSQKAEHEFVGVNCGLLDQLASLLGRSKNATFIDCRTFAVEQVPLSDHVNLVIADSRVQHALTSGEYNDRHRDCQAAAAALKVPFLRDATLPLLEENRGAMSDQIYRRALHIIGENERVLAGAAALRAGELDRFGALMFASHESSRVNFENSCPELDLLVETARAVAGVHGARLSGGGFGGSTINLVEAGREEALVAALRHAWPQVECLITPAAAGALEKACSIESASS